MPPHCRKGKKAGQKLKVLSSPSCGQRDDSGRKYDGCLMAVTTGIWWQIYDGQWWEHGDSDGKTMTVMGTCSDGSTMTVMGKRWQWWENGDSDGNLQWREHGDSDGKTVTVMGTCSDGNIVTVMGTWWQWWEHDDSDGNMTVTSHNLKWASDEKLIISSH